MALNIHRDVPALNADFLEGKLFLNNGLLETKEQIRRFELLRLAFFVLKLRKLEQRGQEPASEQQDEQAFRRNLLRHAIFQQVLTLIRLDGREQAMQIIDACQK